MAALTDREVELLVIDLGAYLRGEPGAAEKTAHDLRQALEEIGFFYIINHGIPKALRDRVVEVVARFHAQPLERKISLKINDDAVGYVPNRGQLPKTSEYYTGSKKPDVGEAFMVQCDWGDGDARVANQWPEGMPEFRHTAREFFDSVEELGIRMLPLFAIALDLEPNFFDDKFLKHKGLNTLRLAHMPPDKLDSDEFNIAPHTDSSFMTLLATSDQPGLELNAPSGQWLKAPPMSNAFIVNAGDMLTRWSNGKVRSTPHRVVNTSGVDRYSIPFFMHPAPEIVIECLDSCCGSDNPPKEPPISCEAYSTGSCTRTSRWATRATTRPDAVGAMAEIGLAAQA